MILFFLASEAHPQTGSESDSLHANVTLLNCVRYALVHQPAVKQSLLDEEITENAISGRLAGWYPQLNFNYSIQHNPQLPTSIAQGSAVKIGLANSSAGQISLSQTLFNRDVFFASSTAGDVRRRMTEQTISAKINTVVQVSKAFYAVLVTEKELEVLDEDIVRLERSFKDAYDLYEGGIADKIDYKRATIALNNVQAERRQNAELLQARYAFLREQMGLPSNARLKLSYDSGQMEREALFDTLQTLHYESRIEYQLLETQKRLQEANLSYTKWSFLPTMSLNGSYSANYMSDGLAQIYGHNYPSSFINFQLSFPIFEGGRRLDEIGQARLEVERIEYDFISLRNSMSVEFTLAMANYKSDLNNYRLLGANLELAKDVYETIELQYKAGTKTYLEVITAETDLRTAQVNHTNALYEVLSSKLDVQRALGTLRLQ